MSRGIRVSITLSLDRRLALAAIAALAVFVVPLELGSETLDVQSGAPSGFGKYNNLITSGFPTTGGLSNTILSNKGGTVYLTPFAASGTGGRVGVGVPTTLTPNGNVRLEVDGPMLVQSSTLTPCALLITSDTGAGTLQINNDNNVSLPLDFYGYNGGLQWQFMQVFRSNKTVILQPALAGNVGIGTTPGATNQLDVNGTLNATTVNNVVYQ